MRIFVTKEFARFARKEAIGDSALCATIARIDRGSIDADLGGGLIKQRVTREGQGRSGGYRTIIAFNQNDRSFFMYGFAKNQRANISRRELAIIKATAAALAALNDDLIEAAVDGKGLREIFCDAREI